MFESISESFQSVLDSFRGAGKLTEDNIKEGLREVRKALLQADVNYQVVKDFINRVEEKAVGEEVLDAVQPDQMIVKIVSDELENLMGPVDHDLPVNSSRPTVLMLAGLQGSGKTTSCGKLAKYLEDDGHDPLMVAADMRRPAAIDQLITLGEDLDLPVLSDRDSTPPDLCERAIQEAESRGCDYVLLDTAGRLHIDDDMMSELRIITNRTDPDHIFLVADAMTGQDAVNSAEEFNEQLSLDSVILTKLDGDARGGAALSIKAVTDTPIQFIGTGEKLDDLEPFHPDRMASRILGMGDVVTLVEKAQETMDEEEAERMQEKIRSNNFDLQDMLDQFKKVQQMGPIKQLLQMVPGMSGMMDQLEEFDESEIDRVEAIILSMTLEERRNPDVLNYSRKKRIARGSGTSLQEVNTLIKKFNQMKEMMQQFQGAGEGGQMPSSFPLKDKLPF